MAPVLTLDVEQGSRFERIIRRRSGDVLTDMTGWLCRGHVRRRKSDTAVIAAFHFALQPDPLTTQENRQWLMWLTPTETAALAPGCYYYDVEMVPNADESLAERVLQGTVNICAEVTRG